MASLYSALRGIHNLVGGLTLLMAVIAAAVLLVTASTNRSALTLRVALICASLQGLLGILLIVLALLAFGGGYVATFWLHYGLGLLSVALVSIIAGRARRSPDGAARGFGGALLGVAILVAIAYYVGMTQS